MPKTTYKSYEEYNLPIGDAVFTFFTDTGAIPVFDERDSGHHSHKFCELFYVAKGEIEITAEGTSYRLGENDAALIPAGTTHKSTLSHNSRRIVISFVFSQSKARSREGYYNKFRSLTEKGIVTFPGFAGADSFRRFARYYYGNYSEKHQLILSCLHEIIILAKEFAMGSDTNGDKHLPDSILYRNYIIADYLETSFSCGSLSELAAILHLSCQQTHRIIKRLYGKSFGDCIMDTRMKNAASLMKDPALTFSDIGATLGYKCTHSFFTAFKKYYGVTPSLYRKNINSV